MSQMAIGMPFYREENYAKMKDILHPHQLPATYSEWLDMFNKAIEESRAKGLAVEHVDIDPETFSAWCRDNVAKAGYEGLRGFVHAALLEKHGGMK